MTETLVPAQKVGGEIPQPLQPRQVQATIMFQDENYTFMRNKEVVTQQDIFDMPLHLLLIGMGMLDARNYMPKIGRREYEKALRDMKNKFDDMYMTQVKPAKELSKGTEKKG